MHRGRDDSAQHKTQRRICIRYRDKPKGKHRSEAVVPRGEDQETCHIPQCPPHILRHVADKRCADIYSSTADVPLRPQYDERLCRPAEQDKDQSPEKAAGVHRTMTKASRFMHTHHAENQC